MTAAPDVDALSRMLGGGRVDDLQRLTGGASRETWSFLLDGRRLVLRQDPPGAPSQVGMAREGRLLVAAAAAGMAVPEVLASSPTALVLSWLDGETIPRRILRDDAYQVARTRLVDQCAEQLARLHTRVHPEQVSGLAHVDELDDVMRRLDDAAEPHPAFELALRWLAENRPPRRPPVVLHGDFRLGNLMVDGSGLVAVLDWELAHLGDPLQDLAWLCVRSWRFGARLPVAGMGTRDQLIRAYEAAGGEVVDTEALHWWEVFCTVNWGVMCLQQSRAHLVGGIRSVELAVIGRRACEVELDVLDLLPSGEVHPQVPEPERFPVTGPHDRPTAAELAASVREFLSGLEVTGHDAFLLRVSIRSLRIVERELELGTPLAHGHSLRLAGLGVASDTELADAIRCGRLEPSRALPAVRAAVVAKLHVADPSQLVGRYDDSDAPLLSASTPVSRSHDQR